MAAQVFGPTTVPDLLGRDLNDERSLTLTSAPVHVIRESSAHGDRFAVVIGAALGSRAVMDLLYVLAPYKAHGPDRFSRVLDNWGLHDRALTSDTSERLMLEHARSLKSSWAGFTQHRRAFMDVLRDGSGSRKVIPVMAWRREATGRREWQSDIPDGEISRAVGQLVSEGLTETYIDTLAGLVTVPYFLPELRKHWRAWQPLVRNGKSNYVGPASVPVVALMHRRAILNSAFVTCAEALAQAEPAAPSSTRLPG